MLQIILLHLLEPVLSKCCKSYCCTCYNLSCQNAVNHTAAPVATCHIKMLQIILLHLLQPVMSKCCNSDYYTCMRLLYQFQQIMLLHLYETVPKADHHSVSSFFTTYPIMPLAQPQPGSPFLPNPHHPQQQLYIPPPFCHVRQSS